MSSPSNSQVIIMNLALSFVKQRQITSPTEASEQARKCSLFYHRARRAALRMTYWNFCTVQQKLALLGSVGDSSFDPTWATVQDVVPGYSFLYSAPSNCLRVRSIFNPASPGAYGPTFDSAYNQQEFTGVLNGNANSDIRWELLRAPKSNVMALATDLKDAWVKFTYDITDESQFDDMFVEAFALELAMRICLPLTADESMLRAVASLREAFVAEAKRINGGEGTERLPRNSAYEDARGA